MTSHTDVYDEDALELCDAFAGYLSLALQKSALRDRARRLEELIVVDALTGIANRRAFDAALECEWARALRTKRSLAVALLDIDHFKLYNDAYGHPQGDACLQQIARARKASVIRATDCFARYGGEEFGLVIADAEEGTAGFVAERLRAAVEALAIPHAGSPRTIVTASVWVAAMLPTRTSSASELLERADRALYRAKGTGRNRIVLVDTASSESTLPAPARTPVANNLPSRPPP